ncbi:MAG: amidase family protein, partial [Geminicoccaceae bacterium]
AALRGRQPEETPLPGGSDLRLLVPENVVLDDLDDAVDRNFEASLTGLERAGVRIERRRLPLLDEVVATTMQLGTLAAAEAYAHYRDVLEGSDVDKMDRRVAARMLAGKSMNADDIAAIRDARSRLASELADALDGAFLAMPTVPHTAPEIAPLEADDELFHRMNMKTNRNASIGNFLGTPGVAMPNGVDHGGLPTSFLLSAIAHDDDRLLAAGRAIERIIDDVRGVTEAP